MSIAYPTSEQGRLAQPVMNRGTGGFAVNYSDNAQAQRETGIPIEGFVQEAGAMGKVGEAAVNVSEYASKMADQMIASKNREAVDKAEIFKAEGEMELASAMANEKDPLKWGELSKQITTKWTEAALADKGILPAARAAITQKMTLWDRGIGAQVIRSAHDQQLKKETAQLGGMVITAAHNARDPATARRLTQEGVERGIIGEDTAARWNIHIEEEEKKAQELQRANETIKLTNTQGPEAAKKYIADSGADEVEKDRLTKTVERAERENVDTTSKQFEDAVARGVLNPNDPSAVVTPKQVKDWRSWDPNITDTMRARMMTHVVNMNDATRRQNVLNRAPQLASQYYTEALNFEFERDGLEKYMELRMKIAELPPGIEGEVSGVLEKKFPGRGEGKEETMAGETEKYLTLMLNKGRFGSFDNGQGFRYDTDGKKVPTEPGDPREEHVRDESKWLRALTKKSEVGAAMRAWAKENPEKAKNPQEVEKELTRLSGPYFRMDAAGDFTDGIAPAIPAIPTVPPPEKKTKAKEGKVSSVTNVPYEAPDLPENPGPASSILIPYRE